MHGVRLSKTLARTLACSLVLPVGLLPTEAEGEPSTLAERELTLREARTEALAANAELRAAASRVEEARGRLIEARTYPHDPELEIELADRDNGVSSSTDRGLGIRQQIELAGQTSKRTSAARAELGASEALLARRRREVLAATDIAFLEALAARDLLAVAEGDVALTAGLARFEERRLEAGAGTQLALNLARVASGRSQNRRHAAEMEWLTARARLAEAIGADPADPPLPTGELSFEPVPLSPIEQLTRRALEARSDLAALRLEVERAERTVEVERARRVPDLKLGAFTRREEGDDLLGGSVSLSIPLFDRHQGRRAESRAALSTRQAELLVGERSARREVAEAAARIRSATRGLAALQGLVIGTLEENLDLLQRAFEAGKVSASDVLVLRRELIEGRREQIAAAREQAKAVVELELAVGGPISSSDPQENRP